MRRWILIVPAVLFALAAASCQGGPPGSESPASAPATGTNAQYFEVKGVVQEVNADGRSAVIQHEAVPNYMPAMTMPFDVKDTNELRGLLPGDAISFRMIVTPKDGWIDQVKKLNTSPSELPSRPAFRLMRDVEPLKEGELLPDYHFTNELNQAVSIGQFKGQALAFTFFFTRCPFPTFCPLVSNNFDETARKLLALPGGPTNWHMLSISFDPEHDTPAILKGYASRYHYDPAHWSFVTGNVIDLTALGDQVTEAFWREGDSYSHNLRTVVIDARGRVQKIILANKWTSDELVAEMVKAAAAK